MRISDHEWLLAYCGMNYTKALTVTLLRLQSQKEQKRRKEGRQGGSVEGRKGGRKERWKGGRKEERENKKKSSLARKASPF